MRSLAHVLPRGRPADEETPQVTGCGYRVGSIAEEGIRYRAGKGTHQGTGLWSGPVVLPQEIWHLDACHTRHSRSWRRNGHS